MKNGRPQKKVIKNLGFHLLAKFKVEEKKKLADGSMQTVEKDKFVRVGGLFAHRDEAQAEAIKLNRPYRIVGVRVDAMPVSTFSKRGDNEVTFVKE